MVDGLFLADWKAGRDPNFMIDITLRVSVRPPSSLQYCLFDIKSERRQKNHVPYKL